MGKGAETRERILEHAFRVAARDGLDGVTIGGLASELGMSKSGLFAHFGSKEDLQIAVLDAAADRFGRSVVRPALDQPRGVPRIRALFERWLAWDSSKENPGGCLFIAAATELDDVEGRPRDRLVETQQQILDVVARAARIAIDEKQFRADLDVHQFAFDVLSILLGTHHVKRLIRDPRADEFAKTSFHRLLASAAAATSP